MALRHTHSAAGRPPSPTARRAGVFVRVTSDELELIDQALQPDEGRAGFLRTAALEKAQRLTHRKKS